MSRLILILITLCVNAGVFCSCDKIDENISADLNASVVFESEGSFAGESESTVYSDSFYEETVYIKCGDVSEMPNYESVYQFKADGTMLYSKNIYSGFSQSEAEYYIRKYPDTVGYEIWYFYNGKIDYAVKLFTVDGNDTIGFADDAPTSFIDEIEFNTIYTFHKQWNEEYE